MRSVISNKTTVVGSLKERTRKLSLFKEFKKRLIHYSERHPLSVSLTSVGSILCAIVYIFSVNQSAVASGSWTQTDWSGGSGSSTTNQYSSLSNTDVTSTVGRTTLSKNEELSNGSLDSDANDWSTDYLYATPSLVQLKSNKNNLATTVTTTLNATPTPGNTLFLAYSTHSAGGGITPPTGYTLDYEYKSDYATGKVIIFRKVAVDSEPSAITVTSVNAQYATLDVYEFSGVSTTLPLDRTSTGTNTTGASSLSINPTTTTSQINELALAVAGWASSVSTPLWSNDFIKNTDAASAGFGSSAYKIIPTESAVSTSISISGTPRVGQGFIATYKTDPGISASTHETTTVRTGGGAQKLVAASSSAGAFTQALNLGDADGYNLEAYIYTDGSAVTGSDAVLMADASELSTTYTSVGGGWYKLSGTFTGTASNVNYGIKVKAGKTIYVDDFSLYKYAPSGTLTSNIYDTLKPSNWGTLSYTSSGSVQIKARSSNSSTMSGAPAFSTCVAVSSGSDISTGTGSCVNDAQRYIQYEVTLSTASTETTATLDDITFDFVNSDAIDPITNASDIHLYTEDGGDEIAENDWLNVAEPYFSWDAGVDNVGGLGIKGYCLYLGQTQSADPETTQGLLESSSSPLDIEGSSCPFAVSGTSFDLSLSNYLTSALSSDDGLYYLNIKAIDNSDNIINTSESFAFKYDNTKPTNPAYITAPSYFINIKEATMTWATSGGDAASDAHSGVVGLQYRIGAGGTWYGDSHTGDQDSNDLLANDGSYTTISTPDFGNLIDGNNVVYFRTWDDAGNVSTAYATAVIKINTTSPTEPQSVVATPSTNTTNSFAFSWEAPATFGGSSQSSLVYCYSVNTLPSVGTCSYTNAGVTNLLAGPYATQPGENTFYVVAQDEAGNINYATASSVTFTANTSAPGIPLNMDVVDISVKSTDNWRLALSWDEPTDAGAGIASYKVYRSTNNTTFTSIASTAGTSYVDSGLSQQKYYYKVRACDSANNCGAYTGAVDETPTGKYTTPANSTSTPEVTNVSTRKATINWSTDRQSDSRIQYGVKSGQYFATEAAISDQVTDHEVLLNNLTAGTTYYYKAKWTDEDGNTGQSAELSFKTAPAPVVKEVTSEPSLSDADISFTSKDAAKVKIYFGKSENFGGITTLNTSLAESKYGTTLTGLDDGSKYFYKLNTLDSDGNEYEGNVYSFTTPPRPRITNLRFQPVKDQPSSTQKVTWNTNVPASSEITYGVRRPTQTLSQSKLTTEHEVTIKGLSDDSDYVLIARSRDASGNVATSDQQSFKTALDTRPPKISDITVDASIRGTGAEARGQVVISWMTDEPATSQVAYGEGSSGFLSSVSSEDAKLTTDHVVVVSDLSTSRVYHFEPRSFDRARNEAKGDQQVAIIGRASENVLSIIFNALQKMFGIN